ncbi:hypothetical protein B0T24DRAFT_617958 [Lasiosphaeria ovina]|uniref:Uncharacterized protein n=1 Tax=Lasiosphaeria ovina TaxID=92902 RepID=A0AAE0KH69_9PEZI|nr:hypothetical protein B0T24DRAFT_617958 [Lasiosphaeria ovina]
MQFQTLIAAIAFAAFGAAQTTSVTSCTPGTYQCGWNGSKNIINVCNASHQLQLTAICSGSCQYINGLPYCV